MKPKTWTLPKFQLLASRVGSPIMAAGLLQYIWHLAATFDDEGGKLPTRDADELFAGMNVDGADETLENLIRGRWLDDRDDGLYVHDWQDHKPKYVTDRVRKRKVAESSGNSATVAEGCGKSINVANPLHSASPSASDSASVLEIKNVVTNVTTTTPANSWSGDCFPLAGGRLYHLPIELLARYQATYAWDVEPELRKCAQWCRENKPQRSKSAKGMQTRITKWLNRVDDHRTRDGPSKSGGGVVDRLLQGGGDNGSTR